MSGLDRVRGWLARVCSADTMTRIVDPTLADACFEGSAWRGWLALARALMLHGVVSLPWTLGRMWADHDRALPRVALWSMAGAALAALPLIALPLSGAFRHSPSIFGWQMLMLVPQAVALTLPAGLLAAVPFALRGLSPTRRLVARIVALSMVYAAVTFVTVGWVVPASNQAFRVASAGRVDIPRGPAERTLPGMRRDLREMQTLRGPAGLIRSLEYEYEMRIALATAAIPIGLAALALTFSRAGRRHPILTGGLAFIAYVGALFPLYGLCATLARVSAVPAGSAAWLPNATLILAAGVIAASSVGHSTAVRHT